MLNTVNATRLINGLYFYHRDEKTSKENIKSKSTNLCKTLEVKYLWPVVKINGMIKNPLFEFQKIKDTDAVVFVE